MSKPEWLKEQEARWNYKTCKGCQHVGPVIGLTKNAGNGRQEMYVCKIHPTPVYLSMIACEDYEQ